ncbi:putative leucine-rich repeat-containing protein DDB_G0290503 [Dreissena polymorpha]|uniref:putative leucine-rich repeat-containing protein DDB_G0290503 n=1 Tax=Dreissena polymorpha TaxID=45954 RepID=UPI002263FEEB|nr:putative leucine-rich repeat-containing protein DDB_G0290503 [Dreissena polymorpha]
MLRNIGNVVCFIIVFMTSHHVTGRANDVTQLNRRLTILKNSVEDDINDIRLEILDLKMTVEQIVVGQRNSSDGSIIGHGMTDINQREITDLKNKLNAHESRLNRLFSAVSEIQVDNSALKSKVNQLVVEKEDKANAELLRLNAGIETNFGDKFNALQKKFEETAAVMMKGYKDLKTHVFDQTNTLSQSMISEQNKLSIKIDKAIVRLDGEVNKLEVNALVEKNERNELMKNFKAELLQLNAGVETKCDDRVNTLQKKLKETAALNMDCYKDLETRISVQMNNFSQSLISEQNKLSTNIDKADTKIVRLALEVNKLKVNALVEKNERNELMKNFKVELLQLNAGVETKLDDRVNTLQKKLNETAALSMAGNKDLETRISDQMNSFSQSLISEQNKLSIKIDKAIVRVDGEVNKLQVNALVEKNERNELIKNLKAELLQLNAGVNKKCDDRVNALQNNLSARIDKADANIVKLDASIKDLKTQIGKLPLSANGYPVKRIFGSDLEKHIKFETRVVRGENWSHGDEDGGGPGKVIGYYAGDFGDRNVMVSWDKAGTGTYLKVNLLILRD